MSILPFVRYDFYMERKTLVWIAVFLGSIIGGYIPSLWGAGIFSFSSVVCSSIGAIVGIWLVWKLAG